MSEIDRSLLAGALAVLTLAITGGTTASLIAWSWTPILGVGIALGIAAVAIPAVIGLATLFERLMGVRR